VKVRVAVCDVLPLVPVIVITWVPVGAVLDTVRVKSDVPEPVTEVGLKLPVTPVGIPVADKATGELNPPESVTVTTANPLWPRSREPAVGDTETVKEPVAVAVTVSDIVVVCVIPPPVPVTVMVYVPGVVVDATVKVAVDDPEPGAAIDAGLKLTVTPVGAPVAVSAMAELNPPETKVVIVELPLLPTTTESAAGDDEMLNAGVCVPPPPLSVLIRPAPLGLPQPVTRS
jgi:hypothetical protein